MVVTILFILVTSNLLKDRKVPLHEGGQLIVGLDSDRKIREDKGDTRPINTFKDRKVLLESIRYVDLVLEFDTKD